MPYLQKMIYFFGISITTSFLLIQSDCFAASQCPDLSGMFLCEKAVPYWTNAFNQVTLSRQQVSTSDPSLFEYKFIATDEYLEEKLISRFSHVTDGIERAQRELLFTLFQLKAFVSTSASCLNPEDNKITPSLIVNETWKMIPLDDNQNEVRLPDSEKFKMTLKYTLHLTPQNDLLINLHQSIQKTEADSDLWVSLPDPYKGSSVCKRMK